MKYVSIDPGLTGGIAFFENEKLTKVLQMPVTEVKYSGNKSGKREVIDLAKLREIINNEEPIHHAILEKVTAGAFSGGKETRTAGATSSFRFGQSFGQIEGLLSGLCITTVLVSPITWKSHYKKIGYVFKDKASSVEVACDVFPDWIKEFTTNEKTGRKKSMDGIADAAMIGKWFIDNKERTKK